MIMPMGTPTKKTVFIKARRAQAKAEANQKPRIEPPNQNLYATKRKGHRLPKGTTMFDKVNRPSFMTRKEAVEYERMRSNYNRRVNRISKNMQKRFPNMDREDFIRRGIIPAPMRKSVLDISDRRQFNKLKKAMRSMDSKKWKAEKQENARNKFVLSLDRAYSFESNDVKKWAAEVFNSMDVYQLVEWEHKNPNVVSDFFYAYQLEKAGRGGELDEDEMDNAVFELIESLKEYAKKPVPQSYIDKYY